jgi:hypothetical protein
MTRETRSANEGIILMSFWSDVRQRRRWWFGALHGATVLLVLRRLAVVTHGANVAAG